MPEDKGLYRKKNEQFSYNPKGKNYLFVVGINDYQHFTKLSNAVKDAQDLVEVLTTYYHFEKDNIVKLFDKEATRKNIFNKFEYLAGRLEKDDNLLIYFSGHGHLNPRTNIGYWIPVEAENVADYVQNSSIRDYLHSIDTHHTFLVADACFSGSLFSSMHRRLETERYLTEVDKHKSRWALTSGRLEVVSDGQMGANSPFATYLLKFLKEQSEAPFAVYDLVQYVKKATANNAEQTPLGGSIQGVGDEGGEFVFYPKENEEIAWQNALLTNTAKGYENFLEKYPQSGYASQAAQYLRQVQEMEEEEAYDKARKINTALAYYDYLESYPSGSYAAQAKIKMKEREQAEKEKQAKEALERAKRTRSLSELIDFKDQYQNFPDLIAEANVLIADIKKAQAEPQTFEKFQTFKTPDNKVVREDTDNGKVREDNGKGQGKQSQIQQREKAQMRSMYIGLGSVLLVLVLGFFGLQEYQRQQARKQTEKIRLDSLARVAQQRIADSTALAKRQADSLAVLQRQADSLASLQNAEARKADSTAFAEAEKKKDYATYLQNYPQGIYALQAQDLIDAEKQRLQKTIDDIERNMVYVAGSSFQMGCDESRDGNCNNDEKPLHTVRIDNFYISKYEVTQKQWREVMGSDPLELYNKNCNQCPVERVSWDYIQIFLKKINQFTDKKYRLPTEEEWEYAARGGNKSKGYEYAGSDDIDKIAWYNGNSQQSKYGLEGTTHPVGSKKPNELGLYDLSGNVWEWTASGWSENYKNSRIFDYSHAVLRGGAWGTLSYDCRVASRNKKHRTFRSFNYGFRLAQD